MPGLAAELERLTRVRVRLADPLARVQVDDSHRGPRRPGLAGRRDRTGGGGLMRAVNLLPEQSRPRQPADAPDHDVGCSPAARHCSPQSCLFVGVSFVQSHGKASDRRDTLGRARAEGRRAQGRPGPDAPPSRAATRPGSPPSRSASGARMKWDDLLDDISRVLPDRVVALEPQRPGGHDGAGSGRADAGDLDRPDRVHRLGRRVHAGDRRAA